MNNFYVIDPDLILFNSLPVLIIININVPKFNPEYRNVRYNDPDYNNIIIL